MAVEIIPYQKDWPAQFQALAAVLRRGLGELAVRIDHIGSTSVPEVAAKDIIDIQVTVRALDETAGAAMHGLGYTKVSSNGRDHPTPLEPSGVDDWTKGFFSPPSGQRPSNTHARAHGGANQRYALLFRDYLRLHPATAAAYAELKRRLARHLADGDTYPEVKDPVVDLNHLAAPEWAEASHWQPGPSDT